MAFLRYTQPLGGPAVSMAAELIHDINVVKKSIKSEPVGDVLAVFAWGKGSPDLDMMFGRYRREVIMSGEFFEAYRKLFDEGVLKPGEGGCCKRPELERAKIFGERKIFPIRFGCVSVLEGGVILLPLLLCVARLKVFGGKSVRAVEKVFKYEPVEDVLTLFALEFGIPSLDRMYGTYNPDVRTSGEFLATYQRLFDEGVLVGGPRGPALKGPNWKTPKFLLERKYVDPE